jgi:hypothetical protein
MEFSEVFDQEKQTWSVYRLFGPPGNQVLQPWVKIMPSTIAGAGNGVYACRRFDKGDILAFYTGAYVLSRNSIMEGHYALEATAHRVIDGAQCGNWTKYINDGTRNTKRSKSNVAFCSDAAVKASKNILQGTEILIDYGGDYWEAFDSHE